MMTYSPLSSGNVFSYFFHQTLNSKIKNKKNLQSPSSPPPANSPKMHVLHPVWIWLFFFSPFFSWMHFSWYIIKTWVSFTFFWQTMWYPEDLFMLESILKILCHVCSSFLNFSQSFCFSLQCCPTVCVLLVSCLWENHVLTANPYLLSYLPGGTTYLGFLALSEANFQWIICIIHQSFPESLLSRT